MKVRRSIRWLTIAAGMLVVILIWFGKKKPTSMPVASIQTNASTPSVTTTAQERASVRTNVSVGQAVATPSGSPLPLTNEEEQVRQTLSELNNVDVEFYGKIEDQFGNAVGNAQIKFEIPFNDGQAVGVHRGTTQADQSGFFVISGYKGKSLSTVPVKQGYILASTNGGGIYSFLWPESQRVHPDRNNPVVIKMWKLQGAEALVDISKEYKVPFTTAPIFIDLIAGRIVPAGGDLEAVVTRSPGPLSKKNPADWSIHLRPVEGGIAESEYRAGQITFEAPADDYQADYLFQMNGEDPGWHDGIDKEFFLKSRNGQVYSKFYLVFGINRAPSDALYFQFRGVANTNGSRNWEATAPQ